MKIIGKNKTFSIVQNGEGKPVGIDGNHVWGDIVEFADNNYHLLHNDRGYQIYLMEVDQESKTFKLRVNGNIYTLKVITPMDELLDKMGINSALSKKIDRIAAPMPGLVINILVAPGDRVKKGDNVLVLEAMKMENIIKAPADGTVKSVATEKGKAVEKNAPLIFLE
ncbi:MAG: acetyl-CoA carboxylase biotin carboxyl carrier protein subunit [Flavobacteriales bacterium]|nr:acetyl-CoA carboxylase biotin carboxyl carrier protein subunit [Flavobacteriales bacterium]